jgi:hypothetical protein
MELKDYITIGVSVTALSLSIISFYRTRKSELNSFKKNAIIKKYDILSLIEIQELRMSKLLDRISRIKDQDKRKKADDLKSTIEDLVKSSQQRSTRILKINVNDLKSEDEIYINEMLGLLSQRDSVLLNSEYLVEKLESTKKKKS